MSPVTRIKLKTVGLAKKVWAPVAAQLITLAGNWIISGEFGPAEKAQVVALVSTAFLGWIVGPNPVIAEEVPE